jgi:hypothetical protein
LIISIQQARVGSQTLGESRYSRAQGIASVQVADLVWKAGVKRYSGASS